MIRFDDVRVVGFPQAIKGMRNPLNSWAKSDSSENVFSTNKNIICDYLDTSFDVGEADLNLMKKLHNNGPVHSKYKRMIVVYVDITAPLYWWKEFDTYKIGTVANSCSTMHTITKRDLTLSDFSCEHLTKPSLTLLDNTIKYINSYRNLFVEQKDKEDWWQIIQLLPSSFNQMRTVMLNYEVLTNIYNSRQNHKLDEWRAFCGWIKEELPYGYCLVASEA